MTICGRGHEFQKSKARPVCPQCWPGYYKKGNKIKKLTFITGNISKAEQLSWHLDYPVPHKKLDLPEIQSLDVLEIVREKAKAAYKILRAPVLVEDTSLVFHALHRLPGPLIKWFDTELGNKGLCELLDGHKDRSATASVCSGYYDGKTLRLFTGERRGFIAKKPKGENGFGWDPIFIPEGAKKTWGQMSRQEQEATSMRRIALKKLERFLKGGK